MSDNGSYVDAVRRQIQNQFEELGFPLTESPAETLLIRNGHFCGRRFHQGDAYAIWLFNENVISFFDSQDAELLVFTPPAEDSLLRRAAGA